MKIEGDKLELQTPSEAVLFLWSRGYISGHGRCQPSQSFSTPEFVGREEVLEVITPEEGDAVFWWSKDFEKTNTPAYSRRFVNNYINQSSVKANALTIGKTVGELRALLSWAKGESNES